VIKRQDPKMQEDALLAAGCLPENIFTDKGISGAKARRPQLDALLSKLVKGDVLVVWKLDRWGRSLLHLANALEDLRKRGVAFRSLTENIDTNSPCGYMLFGILATVAGFERSLISERTKSGMAAARAAGSRQGNNPKATPEGIAKAKQMRSENVPMSEIARQLGVTRATVYRWINP
jgi:DNA invertase Pin-like site-specific DNA recombinase